MARRTTSQRRILTILAVAALGACIIAVFVGPVGFTPANVVRALVDPAAPDAAIIRGLRLPRMLLAFAVGGALAVAGATLQAVVGNPLAEPWLLGISGGASLGAVIGIVVGLPPGWSVTVTATLGALLAILLVYRIALVAGRQIDPRVLLLAGVVVGAFAGAVSAALLAISDPFTFRAAALWLFGGFSGAEWRSTLQFLAIASPPLVAIWWLGRGLDLLALGDDTATALGADATAVRRYAILATAILTAATVAVAGVIGFVGLVVPHAIRWWTGSLHHQLLPAAFLAGGAFTVLADTAARTMLGGQELPVGVITALVGVPVFAVLLRRSAT